MTNRTDGPDPLDQAKKQLEPGLVQGESDKRAMNHDLGPPNTDWVVTGTHSVPEAQSVADDGAHRLGRGPKQLSFFEQERSE